LSKQKIQLMNICINKQEIFDEVEKRSSLEGSVIPERFEGVWASEKDGKFLDSFWIEGYTAVIQLLKRYLVSDTVDFTLNNQEQDETISITADMPARYTHLLDGSVATDIKMLIACNILHGWLKIKAPDIALKYDEEAKGYSEDLRVKLLYRTAPTNPLSDRHKNDDCDIYPRYEFINPAKKDNIRLPEQWGKCNNKETKKELKDYSCPCI
jgi:hypothetical protein